MTKEIRFIDPNYNELFRIPDGGSIVVTRPKGEIHPNLQEQWVGTCKFIDECHTKINGTCFHICQFAEIQAKIGSKVEPEAEPEIIAGYKIYRRAFYDGKIYKAGYNPEAPDKYATWECKADLPDDNYWGHYFGEASKADADLIRRTGVWD